MRELGHGWRESDGDLSLFNKGNVDRPAKHEGNSVKRCHASVIDDCMKECDEGGSISGSIFFGFKRRGRDRVDVLVMAGWCVLREASTRQILHRVVT